VTAVFTGPLHDVERWLGPTVPDPGVAASDVAMAANDRATITDTTSRRDRRERTNGRMDPPPRIPFYGEGSLPGVPSG
jgi:hypothetical protein